jgi:membrane protein implicated in regulation of membrane protease activity
MDALERLCARVSLLVPVVALTVLLDGPLWWVFALLATCPLMVVWLVYRVLRAPSPRMQDLPPDHEWGYRDRPDIRSVSRDA